MVVVDNVTKTYGNGDRQVAVLREIHCQFMAGEFAFILGPSGSGKSTLLYLLGALDVPTSGTISIEGESITRMTPTERDAYRRHAVGFVFQSFNLLKNLDALDNTLVPFLAEGCSEQTREEAVRLLDRMGLKSRMHHRPSQLSGGEQQRVAIARAILKRPKLILADEPTGELDSHTGKLIFEMLRELHEEQGGTVVTVTHDERYLQPKDRVLRIRDGQILDG